MRQRLGRFLLRLGLRLLGHRPRSVVMFSHESWDQATAARWAAAAGTGNWDGVATPADLMVWVPTEAFDLLNEAIAERSGLKEVPLGLGPPTDGAGI